MKRPGEISKLASITAELVTRSPQEPDHEPKPEPAAYVRIVPELRRNSIKITKGGMTALHDVVVITSGGKR
jgi:hypothetical protein